MDLLLRRRSRNGQLGAGSHTAYWDGQDGRGLRTASGVYSVQLRAAHQVATCTLTVVR